MPNGCVIFLFANKIIAFCCYYLARVGALNNELHTSRTKPAIRRRRRLLRLVVVRRRQPTIERRAHFRRRRWRGAVFPPTMAAAFNTHAGMEVKSADANVDALAEVERALAVVGELVDADAQLDDSNTGMRGAVRSWGEKFFLLVRNAHHLCAHVYVCVCCLHTRR